jgi:hypothetical protein
MNSVNKRQGLSLYWEVTLTLTFDAFRGPINFSLTF